MWSPVQRLVPVSGAVGVSRLSKASNRGRRARIRRDDPPASMRRNPLRPRLPNIGSNSTASLCPQMIGGISKIVPTGHGKCKQNAGQPIRPGGVTSD